MRKFFDVVFQLLQSRAGSIIVRIKQLTINLLLSTIKNVNVSDSAFTERYMGLPNVTDNYRGYEESDVTKRAGNLREKLFLLIHGTADDNVHYQQSMMLIQALTAEGVLFRHQVFSLFHVYISFLELPFGIFIF